MSIHFDKEGNYLGIRYEAAALSYVKSSRPPPIICPRSTQNERAQKPCFKRPVAGAAFGLGPLAFFPLAFQPRGEVDTATTGVHTSGMQGFKDISDDMFGRRDEKTDALRGYALFNVKKRNRGQDIDVVLPAGS